MTILSPPLRLFLAFWIAAIAGSQAHTLFAAEPSLNLEARLIWGTNDSKSPDPSHKSLDTELTKWLRQKLKWKYFFEVNRQASAIPLNGTRRIRMSKHCELEVRNLGESRLEVKLFGEGKLVNKMTHSLPKGDWLIIAGDDKNDTAWFVVLKTVS